MVQITGTNELPSDDNIENYITTLMQTLTSDPQQHTKLAQTVKTIVNNLPQ